MTEPNSTAALFVFLGELLERNPPGSAQGVLNDLAHHFGARGAGVAYPARRGATNLGAWSEGERPVESPWQSDLAQLGAIAERQGATVYEDPGGSWLLWFAPQADAADPVVLWLNGSAGRRWSETASATLALAGKALWRAGFFGGATCAAAFDQRLEEAAVVSSRLSHDFGNLLTGILGFTELAMAQVAAGTRAHGYLGEVWNVARNGADWLKRLNLFCRGQRPRFTPAGLPGALADEEARLGAGASPVWQADMPTDLPALACDAESLRQALRQILDNAREATAPGQSVRLTARPVELSDPKSRLLLGSPPPGRYVEVTVADQGAGISDSVRSRLLQELFFSTKPRHRGLGLMVTYSIVRRFGGGMAIGSALAGGTEVRLYFPVAADPDPNGPAQLLVVDDDVQVLTEARRLLEPAGYRVSLATSAAQALALYQAAEPPFDLVLASAHLPSQNGMELARRIRLGNPKASFLFLHAPAGPRLPRDELPPNAVVHKPLAAPVLLQAVAAALRRDRTGPG